MERPEHGYAPRPPPAYVEGWHCVGEFFAVIGRVEIPKRVREDHCLASGLIQPAIDAVKYFRLEIKRGEVRWRLSPKEIGPVILVKVNSRCRIHRKARHVQAPPPVQNRVVRHVSELP